MRLAALVGARVLAGATALGMLAACGTSRPGQPALAANSATMPAPASSPVAAPLSTTAALLEAATSAQTPVDARSFPAGACIRYASSAANRSTTIFLDAGHGGPDPGGFGHTTAGGLIEEKTVTLAVALDAAADLHRAGFTVVLSRTTDTSVAKLTRADMSGLLMTAAAVHADLEARARCANEAHAAVLVSIHFNSGGSPRDAGALAVYDPVRSFAAKNLHFAMQLESDILCRLNARGWAIPKAGVGTDDTVGNAISSAGAAYGHLLVLGPAKPGYFTAPTSMPGALVEPLFLTDPFEANIAASQQGRAEIAAGIATAAQQFLAGR